MAADNLLSFAVSVGLALGLWVISWALWGVDSRSSAVADARRGGHSQVHQRLVLESVAIISAFAGGFVAAVGAPVGARLAAGLVLVVLWLALFEPTLKRHHARSNRILRMTEDGRQGSDWSRGFISAVLTEPWNDGRLLGAAAGLLLVLALFAYTAYGAIGVIFCCLSAATIGGWALRRHRRAGKGPA